MHTSSATFTSGQIRPRRVYSRAVPGPRLSFPSTPRIRHGEDINRSDRGECPVVHAGSPGRRAETRRQLAAAEIGLFRLLALAAGNRAGSVGVDVVNHEQDVGGPEQVVAAYEGLRIQLGNTELGTGGQE